MHVCSSKVEQVLDNAACLEIERSVKGNAASTQILKPFKGENTVSNGRNKWTQGFYRPWRLLAEQNAKGATVGQARLDIEPCFKVDIMPGGLLSGHSLNSSDSAIFVTSSGLRTG
jgi:hypothetical protein